MTFIIWVELATTRPVVGRECVPVVAGVAPETFATGLKRDDTARELEHGVSVGSGSVRRLHRVLRCDMTAVNPTSCPSDSSVILVTQRVYTIQR